MEPTQKSEVKTQLASAISRADHEARACSQIHKCTDIRAETRQASAEPAQSLSGPTHNDVFKKVSFRGAYAEPKQLYAGSVFANFLLNEGSADA